MNKFIVVVSCFMLFELNFSWLIQLLLLVFLLVRISKNLSDN